MSAKFNSKKTVRTSFIIIAVVIALSAMIGVGSRIVGFSNLTLDVFLVFTMFYTIFRAQKLTIFDYDSTSEVVSIKNYFPTSTGKSSIFELPKMCILSSKIEDNWFKKYLVITFTTTKGKCLKKYFDVSACTQNQISQLQGDLSQIQKN